MDQSRIDAFNEEQAQGAEERAKMEDTAFALSKILDSQKGIEDSVKESILALVKFLAKNEPKVSVTNQQPFPNYDEVVSAVKEVVEAVKESKVTLEAVEQKEADYTPIVSKLEQLAEAVSKLPKPLDKVSVTNQTDYSGKFDEVTKAVQGIDIPAPIVNVEKPIIPDNSKELEKLLKAVEKIKFPDIPKTDFSPVEKAVKAVERSINSLQFPVPNYVLPFKNVEGAATQVQLTSAGKVPVEATVSVASAPTFKLVPSDTAETAKFGLVDTAGNLQTDSRFSRVAKANPSIGEELRFDDISAGDLYIGAAVDSTAEATLAWDVCRYYRTATGVITRCRFRSGIAWGNRTVGW